MQFLAIRAGFAGFVAVAALAQGAELSPATLAAWNQYISSVQSRAGDRLDGAQPFLWADESPGRAARLRNSEIVVSPAADHNPRRVPSGMIHDWIAAAFIPGANLDQVIFALREYNRYSTFYHPAVVESKRLTAKGDDDRFKLTVASKAVLSKMALDAEFTASFWRDGDRACRTARATHVHEIEDYGQSSQKDLPEGEGSGYLWRFFSISRMEQRDGGVYIETEMIALSRDIPASIQWLVSPFIRRMARGSLSALLQDTRDAVLTSGEAARSAHPSYSTKR